MCLLCLLSYTSSEADLVVLAGDFNMHPNDLGNRLLRTYADLRDAYVETPKFDVRDDDVDDDDDDDDDDTLNFFLNSNSNPNKYIYI